jgi:hypothetical protein
MNRLRKQTLDLLNEGHFKITNLGPLHAPIHGFSIRRDDKLRLIVETETPLDAKSTAPQYPQGTVRFNTDQVELVNADGIKAVLTGVQTHSVAIHGDRLKEIAQVHELTVTPPDAVKAAYTIEWLENLSANSFTWPDSIRTVADSSIAFNITLTNDGVTFSGAELRDGMSWAAIKLPVAGHDLYVCALAPEYSDANVKPGCMIYVGIPDEMSRKQIRTALSFALGVYLVELGHTSYDERLRLVSATLRAAYSLDKRAFDLAPLPPAPLSNRNIRNDLERTALTRTVNALVAGYSILDLGNLAWAYWHACIATVHIAPAHFGASIEALQRGYSKIHPDTISTRIVAREKWKELQAAIVRVIADADISEDSKQALTENLRGINRVSQRTSLKAVLHAIDLELGSDEDAAWKRRNDAAHGLPIPEGDELIAIRDTKLLKGLFHRMLLRISNAADSYVDYASLNMPYRKLREPPPTA